MKLLVLATNYPDNNENISLMYIHTRNKYYVQNNIKVTVLNFSAVENYIIDGVKVITLNDYINNRKKYEILISHAPNIKSHYRFLKKYDNEFDNIVFFFHGHEVLKISEIYPKPYNYVHNSSILAIMARDFYDNIKLQIWKNYFVNYSRKIHFVFVSNWMYEMFLKYVKIDPKLLTDKKNIIYNSIGDNFETNSYEANAVKEYDFITIRNYLDGSKYCIDVVTKVASLNPNYKFCVVGKGDFFKYKKMPSNLHWIDKTLSHTEVIEFLNKSKYAFIPTRTDAQGVMACEIATFGIPLITSDIEVCTEVFGDFKNVEYINNDEQNINIEKIIKKIKPINKKNETYYAKNTIGNEITLYNRILEK